MPLTLSIDPASHLFRRLYPQEISPGLNVLLEDGEKILVLPEKADEESRKIYADLASMVQKRKGGKILSEKEVTEDQILNSSVMLFGDSWKNPLFSKLVSRPPESRSAERRQVACRWRSRGWGG